MKLIIQIPCFNEEKTLFTVLSELPTRIDGIDSIETMIIDDGSSDTTIEVARNFGVTHIVTHTHNKGLGNAFRSGLERALFDGADILVNTDGDNQYPGKYISQLVKPIIDRKADIVLGDRQTSTIVHFSPLKRFFQGFGSKLVRYLSGTDVPDSVSGFRAYSREALLRLNVTSSFSYAVDTLVQAGSKLMKVESIKIITNEPTRVSRLFTSMWQHMYKTSFILFRVYAMYNPLRIFFVLALPFLLIGLFGIGRFLFFFYIDPVNTGKIQSLLLASVSIIIAIQFFALGIIGDLIAKNRKLIEDDVYYTKKAYFDRKK